MYRYHRLDDALRIALHRIKMEIERVQARQPDFSAFSVVTDIDATLYTEIDMNGRSTLPWLPEQAGETSSVQQFTEESVFVTRLGVIALLHKLIDIVDMFFITARADGCVDVKDAANAARDTQDELQQVARFNVTNGGMYNSEGRQHLFMYPGKHPKNGTAAREDNDCFWAFKEFYRRVVRQMSHLLLAVGDRCWDAMSLEVAQAICGALSTDEEVYTIDDLDASTDTFVCFEKRNGKLTVGIKLPDFDESALLSGT